jgi:two-component system OmpR family sensor kinase
VLDEEKEKFQARSIQVKRNDEITLGLISGEAELIKKCISNILDNAVRFSPFSGTIEINTYVEDQTIICEIKDLGKGFATGAINHVFELFTTGDEYKDNYIGIGLPIAKMIMEGHCGSIIVGNNPGGGASVKLLFQNSIVD